MGDSIIEVSNAETKMGESASSVPTLEVSVSFGRFENDSLSWEKWSSFSPNKYLEEVEKCSIPGSVAQKTAYFEAHYKKIAARKAEQVDHAKQNDSSKSDAMNFKENVENACGTGNEISIYKGQRSTEETEQAITLINTENSATADEFMNDSSLVLEYQRALVDDSKEELNGKTDKSKADDQKETSSVKGERCLEGSHAVLEQPPKGASEAVEFNEEKVEDLKHDARSLSQKVIPINKKQNLLGDKKKPVSPVHKSPLISTPRASKAKSTSNMTSTSRTLTKANASSLTKSKRLSAGESKRAAPTSLHMSLSLGTEISDSVSRMTTRKSLIMEIMGDKDIVKWAFKTFQNNINHSSSPNDERSGRQNKVSVGKLGKKKVTSLASHKENEGPKKAAEKMNAQRSHTGTRLNSMSLGSHKGAGLDEKKGKAAPSSIGFTSNERAKKQIEISKKVTHTLHTRTAEKLQFDSKVKHKAHLPTMYLTREKKAADVKNLTRSLNLNATSSSMIKGWTSKNPIEKKIEKDGIHHLTGSHR